LLRADYLEERRAWERGMRMSGIVDADDGVDGDVEEEADQVMAMSGVVANAEPSVGGRGGSGGDEQEQMSPTEEKEIEALLELWDGDAAADQGDGDSQEWDDVFMEVLSQEQQQHQKPQMQGSLLAMNQEPDSISGGGVHAPTDMDMDMS
jgi:hypothetical protein